MKFIPILTTVFENLGKRKTLDQLRSMTERQLIDCGYSPELLSKGVKAWPWRELPEDIAPLRFDQCAQRRTVSIQTEYPDTPTSKRIPEQQHAA